jgi:hypothetical protein
MHSVFLPDLHRKCKHYHSLKSIYFRVFTNKVLRRIHGHTKQEETWWQRALHNKEQHNLCCLLILAALSNTEIHTTYMRQETNTKLQSWRKQANYEMQSWWRVTIKIYLNRNVTWESTGLNSVPITIRDERMWELVTIFWHNKALDTTAKWQLSHCNVVWYCSHNFVKGDETRDTKYARVEETRNV